MIAAETYLRTQRVAEALGISVSTVKRWVDSGMLRAARTAGKHRLIPYSEAVRLAQELGFPLTGLTSLAEETPIGTKADREQVISILENLLREARASECQLLIESLYRSGWDGVALGDDLIRPVMERIGHSWQIGSLDVYEEHEATQIVASALRHVIDRSDHEKKPGLLALGANVEGDPYVIARLLSEMVLRELGWDVRNLGSNLPLRSLAEAVERLRPRLVFLSVNYLADEERFVREYQSFHEKASAVGTAVIVGGQALGPHIRSRLVFASYGERMAHLAEFARRVSLVPPVSQTRNVGE